MSDAEQRAHVGPGSVRETLPSLLRELSARRVLVVSGRDSFDASGARQRVASALPPRARLVRFSDFARNLRLEDVERGVRLVRECRPDVVLAVGGGSVLDCAKAINLLAVQETSPRLLVTRQAQPTACGGPVIALPTTAGSGSEATRFATVYIDGRKHSLDHPWLRPTAALVDAELCASMSPRLTAVTGMDALSQAIESYWAVRADDVSRPLAAKAIARLLPHLARAVRDGDAGARACMSEGAWLAGRAIDRSRTTAAHALSYPLTMHLGIPHGHAVALTLVHFVRLNGAPGARAINDPRGGVALEGTLRALWRLLGCESAAAAAAMLEALMVEVGLSTSLEDFAVSAALRARIEEEVNPERLGNNPVRIGAGDVSAVLDAASSPAPCPLPAGR